MSFALITTARQRAVVFYVRRCLLLSSLALLAACSAEVRDKTAESAAVTGSTVSSPAYRVETFPKVEGEYLRYANGQVGIGPYRMAQVEREDAQSISVRVYEPVVVTPTPEPIIPAPSSNLPRSSLFALQAFDAGLPREGQWRDDLAIADMDGDGELDIVSAPPRKSLRWPVVFRGDGAGQWTRWQVQFPDIGYDYGSVRVADMDLDGRVDLALAMHLRGFTVLRQDAAAQFSRADAGLPLIENVAEHGATGVKLAWERDSHGRPLLLLVRERLRRAAEATASRQTLLEYVWVDQQWTARELPPQMAAADSAMLIRPDRSMPGTWLLLQSGTTHHVAQLLAGSWSVTELLGMPSDCELQSVAAADVDGDQQPDFALSCKRRIGHSWWSQVELLRSRTGPLTLHAGTLDTTISALAFVRPRSRDSNADLAMLGQRGELMLLSSDAEGGFSRDHVEPAPAWRGGCAGFALHGADLDHDGRDEIVASFAGEPSVWETGPSCRENGGICVWKVLAAAEPL